MEHTRGDRPVDLVAALARARSAERPGPDTPAGPAVRAWPGPPLPVSQAGPGELDLGALLRLSLAASDDSGRLRPASSAGALHPVDTELVVGTGCSLPPGRYGYDPLRHRVHRLGRQPDGTPPGVTAELSVTARRTVSHYGHRAWPLLLLDTGHAAGALYLAAHALGATATEPRLDGRTDSPLAAVHIPPPSGHSASAEAPLTVGSAAPGGACAPAGSSASGGIPSTVGPSPSAGPRAPVGANASAGVSSPVGPSPSAGARAPVGAASAGPPPPPGPLGSPGPHPSAGPSPSVRPPSLADLLPSFPPPTPPELLSRRSDPPPLTGTPSPQALSAVLAVAAWAGAGALRWCVAVGAPRPGLIEPAADGTSLRRQASGEARPTLAAWAAGQAWIADAGAVLLAHGCPADADAPHIRRTHLRAGFAVHLAHLTARRHDLAARPVGSWQQADLGAALGAPPGRDWIVHGLALGTRPADEENTT
ncbi:SagB/ThcOx family dehydrogenase [Streptomyces griseoloalbus]|uniref:nitroreductase family protein n=1 Tax=Streptomyces griseoloalbus TaxID=67303 RepID=UPI0033BA3BE5